MLKRNQKFGKYRIEKRLADGPFAAVYQARDTIEGIRVALKVPHKHLMNEEFLDAFRAEVRTAARLNHEKVLSVKNADFIDGQFTIAMPLGDKTLADRMRGRMSVRTALDYIDQMLEAVAHAHAHRVIHCDIKPENFILFEEGQLRLADFGIAKIAHRTVKASGSGTLGYVAPEQAMGKPSFRSDVFSLGLIMYRLLTGVLPEWPYDWPPPGHAKLRGRVHPELIVILRRAIDPNPRKRYRDAQQMKKALDDAWPRILVHLDRQKRIATRTRKKTTNKKSGRKK